MSAKQWQKLPETMQNEAVKPYFDILQKRGATLFFKRFIEIIISFLVLVVFSPILIICAILVAVTSKGPVFFRQKRVGRYGKPFAIFKFRTMVADAEKLGAQITVGERDPRITKVGHFLRVTRLDELPQMINVLIGEMSLIGTRPEVPRYVEKYTDEMMATLLLRPGISGYASIEFADENERLKNCEDPETYYIETILPEKMAINLDYMKNISIALDIKCVFKTIACVLK